MRFNYKARDFNAVISKLSLEKTSSKRAPHPVYWYVLDGVKTLRVTIPNAHGGSGSLSTGFINAIRNHLKLDMDQFQDLIACPLSADEFKKIILNKFSDQTGSGVEKSNR